MQPGVKLGCTSRIKHQIITSEVHPIAKAPYRVPFSQKEILQTQILEHKNDGIIIDSDDSPWSAPVVLVNRLMPDGIHKVRL